MTKLDKYTVDYIDNGVEHFTTILAHSEGMAEDVFYETFGENMDIVSIALEDAECNPADFPGMTAEELKLYEASE